MISMIFSVITTSLLSLYCLLSSLIPFLILLIAITRPNNNSNSSRIPRNSLIMLFSNRIQAIARFSMEGIWIVFLKISPISLSPIIQVKISNLTILRANSNLLINLIPIVLPITTTTISIITVVVKINNNRIFSICLVRFLEVRELAWQ